MAEAVGDSRRFEAAMHHAVRALLIIADSIGVPVGFLHQLPERAGIALAQEIAGPLPPEDIPRGIAPGRAVVCLIAREEIEKQGRLVERPRLRATTAGKNSAEQISRSLAAQEMFLIGSALIRIAR